MKKSSCLKTRLTLSHAITTGDFELLEKCVKNGADVNVVLNSGGTSLIRAARFHEVEMVRYLVNEGANVNAKDSHGETALHVGSRGEFTQSREILEFLIESGADPNAQNNAGETPVHTVVRSYGSFERIVALKRAGADLDIRDFRGYTPIMRAIDLNKKAYVDGLIEAGARTDMLTLEGETLLHIAVSHRKIIKSLINKTSLDIDALDQDDCTPLMRALSKHAVASAIYLINRGACVNGLSKKCLRTPLKYAYENWDGDEKWDRAIELLIEKGADFGSRHFKENQIDEDTKIISCSRSFMELIESLSDMDPLKHSILSEIENHVSGGNSTKCASHK